MNTYRLTILTCLLFFAVPLRAERYALLIGNNAAQGDYATLKYVQNDLLSMKNILSGFCGFDKSHIASLYNGTPKDLDHLLDSMQLRCGMSRENMFLFYYSGHADQSCLKMGNDTYSLTSLKQKLSTFPVDMRIVMFDACQSGSFTRIKGGKLDEPFLFKDDTKINGQVVLCSSSLNENAQESDALGNSVFTFHFINALRGSGDLSGDGKVTLSEAYQYSYNHTIASTAGSSGGVQHPSYQFRIQGEGDIVLADLNISTQGIILAPDISGPITILDQGNTVVADLAKETKSRVLIALSPGHYRIIKAADDKRYQTDMDVKDHEIETVSSKDFSLVQTGVARKKGGGWQRSVQIGATFFGGYGTMDFSSTTNSLNSMYSSYNAIGIKSAFSTPERQRFLYEIALRLLVRNRFVGTLGYTQIAIPELHEDFSGARNENNGGSYAVRLHTSHSMSISCFEIGTGYKFNETVLNHFGLCIGLNIYNVNFSATSTVSDSLYNTKASSDLYDKGSLVVPYVALEYSFPILSWLDIGARAKYRYQPNPANLSNNSNNMNTSSSRLQYRFGGADGALFINAHFTIKRTENAE